MKESLAECTNATEKQQLSTIILEKERLVDEIYGLVFSLPVGLGLTIINLRYLENMSVDEVCSTLYISKSTYHLHHKKALRLIEEIRDKK